MTTADAHRTKQLEFIQRGYPRAAMLRDNRELTVRLLGDADRARLIDFVATLTRDDLLYLPWDVTDPDVIDRWLANIRDHRTITIIVLDGETMVGWASLIHSETDWTRHMGEIRLTVGEAVRGQGLGRYLAEEIFGVADSLGLERLAARMTADQTNAQAVFRGLGFAAVATLPGWVLARDGSPRDLVVMAYDIRTRRAPTQERPTA